MYTLGIETSCDETSCAVLKDGGRILSNVIASSLAKHVPYGGVVPEIASRHCLEVIDLVYRRALRKAQLKPDRIDLIAVTRGPGLIGSLFVGVAFAEALGFALDVPVIGVNHIIAHLEANFIGHKKPQAYVGLIVSGGHTTLLEARGKRFRLLGETVDDAIGEAYDKTAKILGLGYPGGPVIDRFAQKGNANVFAFTKPKQDGEYDFSFSGIKTRVLQIYAQEKRKFRSKRFLENFCASFQESVVSWVVQKTVLACERKQVKNVVVGGGVSANSRLRALLAQETERRGIELFIPDPVLTTDNAAMVARLGYSLYKSGFRPGRVITDPSLHIEGGSNGAG